MNEDIKRLVEALEQVTLIAAEGARKPSHIGHLRSTIMAMSSTATLALASLTTKETDQ